MLYSDCRVMGLLGSGWNIIPVSGGGKGMTWQKVATHLSRELGVQLLFQAHTDSNNSYFSPPESSKLPYGPQVYSTLVSYSKLPDHSQVPLAALSGGSAVQFTAMKN